MQCTRCAGEQFMEAGRDRQGFQWYCCRVCNRCITERSGSSCSSERFPDEVIALAIRWYLRYRISYTDVAEWLAARGIPGDGSTVYDWVYTSTLLFIAAARAHRFACLPIDLLTFTLAIDVAKINACRPTAIFSSTNRALSRPMASAHVVDLHLYKRRGQRNL